MTNQRSISLRHSMTGPFLYAAGLAIVWLLAAAWRPGMTYHLAPLLVAGTPPVLLAFGGGQGPSRRAVMVAGAVGFAGAVVASLALSAAGLLAGPALQPFATVLVESIVGAGIGAVGGITIALLHSP